MRLTIEKTRITIPSARSFEFSVTTTQIFICDMQVIPVRVDDPRIFVYVRDTVHEPRYEGIVSHRPCVLF
jgi:hypothetical protein